MMVLFELSSFKSCIIRGRMIPRGRYCNTPYLGTWDKVRKCKDQRVLARSHQDGTLHEPWKGPRTVQRSVQGTLGSDALRVTKAVSMELYTSCGSLHDPWSHPWRAMAVTPIEGHLHELFD